MTESGRERILQAAREMDWQQVALNNVYGPPCFHLFDDGFCGRAKRWAGHGDPNHHNFVSFADLLQAAFEAGRGGWISVAPDSLPEFDRKVLLLIEGTVQTGWRVAMENYKPGFWLWLVAMESPDDEDPTTPFNADQVQGWQPLPAPPDSGDATK